MVGMLACFSVLGLYVETILQLYILVSSWNSGTLQASVFILLLVFLLGSFAVTSVASAVSVFSAFRFRDRVPAKVLCGCMHVGQAAFVWRLYRVLFFYDKRDWFELTGLRLVHVSVQSIPYIVLYGRLLVVDVSLLRPLPVLSLVVSLVSATVALCTYTLRRRLHETRLKDSLPSQPSKARRCIGLSLLVFGSTLCLTARLGAFALMSVEHNYWAILPFSIHLLVLLIMHFACFRAGIRSEKSETPVYRQVLERLAKAYLSTFELVEDNFQRVQCRYVAFYSVMLVENLVMAALWMLFSSMDYVARLLVAVGLLAMFLCALVIKFASCGLITQRGKGDTSLEPTDFAFIADFSRASNGDVVNGRCGGVLHGPARRGGGGFVSSTSGSKQSVSVATISSREGLCSDPSHYHHQHYHRHHHHHHQHDRRGHRRHSCPRCEGKVKANSHTTSTVLTDSATVNTSLGRSRSSGRQPYKTSFSRSAELKGIHHSHQNFHPLVTEDNQLHLKEIMIDQMSRDAMIRAARDFHERDTCSFDDPVLASRLVVRSLQRHRKCPHSRRAHSEGSKHRLETCREETHDHRNVRWKTEGFLIHAGEKYSELPHSDRAHDRPKNRPVREEASPPEQHTEHRRGCPKHPRFIFTDENPVENGRTLAYLNKLAKKQKKRQSRHSTQAGSKNQKSTLTKRFLTLSAQDIGWNDNVSLDSDSTSQTSRKAHDSDDLANITSSSDDDSGGCSQSGWPAGPPESEKAATWPRLERALGRKGNGKSQGKATRSKQPSHVLPKHSLPATDFVRMWLENGCQDGDADSEDPAVHSGPSQRYRQTLTSKELYDLEVEYIPKEKHHQTKSEVKSSSQNPKVFNDFKHSGYQKQKAVEPEAYTGVANTDAKVIPRTFNAKSGQGGPGTSVHTQHNELNSHGQTLEKSRTHHENSSHPGETILVVSEYRSEDTIEALKKHEDESKHVRMKLGPDDAYDEHSSVSLGFHESLV